MFAVYADCAMTMSKTLVWISGNTYAVRDDLKKDGFKYSGKKRAWWMTKADYMGKIAAMAEGTDHAIIGTASDGTAVVIAECHHEDISKAERDRREVANAIGDTYGHNPYID